MRQFINILKSVLSTTNQTKEVQVHRTVVNKQYSSLFSLRDALPSVVRDTEPIRLEDLENNVT